MELYFRDISVFTSNSSAPLQRCWHKVFPTPASSTSPRTGLPSAMPITNHLSAAGHDLGVKESLQDCELFSLTSPLLKTQSTNQRAWAQHKKSREQLQHNLQGVSSHGAGGWAVRHAQLLLDHWPRSPPLTAWSVQQHSAYLPFAQTLTALFHILVQSVFI